MKKVAMIVLSQYPGDPRVRREAEALERQGIPVDIICYANPGQSAEEQFGLVKAYRIMQVRDKTSILRYLLFSQWFGLAAFFKLLVLSFSNRYKIIQVHNMPDQLVFVGFLHRIVGIPVVLDLHDLMVELFESKWEAGKARVLLPVVKLVERLSCGFANKLITTSVGFQDRLIGRGIPAEKITLVLNSADNNIFYRPEDGIMERHERRDEVLKTPKLVYHGTVAHRFGIHLLIETVAKLRDRGISANLRIHGKYDEDYLPVLEKMTHDLGLQVQILLGGYLTHEEIRQMLGEMDIGIVPYLSDSFMDLALSTKSFEYVAMGLPVVASRVASMTALFPDDCLRYFHPGDVNDLTEQIVHFCNNPSDREAYPVRADEIYETFAWPVMEARYIEMMRHI